MIKENNNNFFSFLKENGLKPTSQRNLIVKQLLNGRNRHFTAEDLYDEMKLKKIRISLATIYNTLHSFVEKKILKLVSIKEGKTIFCTNMKNHYHFFNTKTGRLIDIPCDEIKILKLPKAPKGTKINNIEITINLNTKN
jgi:Fur family iron response transcriptional regulator|tara:strand:- start:116 stop:532 length:417 start_codon:yes stop_codon:yes gene_type:complete